MCSWIEGGFGGICSLPGCCLSWQCSLPEPNCAHTPLCLARRYPLHLRVVCTRHCALESRGGGQSYLRPLSHVVVIGVVRCCGDWHVDALLFFGHCVHTPLGTWVSRCGRIRSSPQRYDFGVWHGYTRTNGLPIAGPAATLVVRRQFQRHILRLFGCPAVHKRTLQHQRHDQGPNRPGS